MEPYQFSRPLSLSDGEMNERGTLPENDINEFKATLCGKFLTDSSFKDAVSDSISLLLDRLVLLV